jgi:RNA polymerase sigma-B factor
LVETFANRYARAGVEPDDLVQAGSIGLLNAIERFDARRGDEFAAFAVPTVVGEIKRHIRDRGSTIKLPRALQEAGARLPRVEAELTAHLEREPSGEELAAELGVATAELERLREVLRAAPAPEAAAADQVGGDAELDLSDERVMLAGAFHVLDETERSIVYLRFVRDLGTAKVAADLGLSDRQLARRTQAALAKLRGELERGGAPGESPGRSAAIATAPAGQAGARPSPRDRAATAPARRPTGEQPPRNGSATAQGHPSPRDGGDAPTHEGGADSEGASKRRGAHSGRLLLRMPQSLHAELAEAAEREEVSLNQFITNSLAAAVHWRRPEDATSGYEPEQEPPLDQPAAQTTSPPPRWLRAALLTNIVVVAVAAVVAVVLLLVAWQQGW